VGMFVYKTQSVNSCPLIRQHKTRTQ